MAAAVHLLAGLDWSQGVPLPPGAVASEKTSDRIKLVAQMIKDANPDDPETSQVVERCWKAARELPKGKEILQACEECLKLPKTQLITQQSQDFIIHLDDGDIVLPVFLKEALAKDSFFFRPLFFGGMHEMNAQEITIQNISKEHFIALLRVWMGEERPQNAQESINLLVGSEVVGLHPSEIDPPLIAEIDDWQPNIRTRAEAYKLIKEFKFLSQPVRNALERYFMRSYFGEENQTIRQKIQSSLLELKPSALPAQIGSSNFLQFVELVKLLPATKWDLTLLEQMRDDNLLQLIENCPNIQSLNLSHCRELTDRSVSRLGSLKHLKHLDISHCRSLSDAAFVSLGESKSIISLDIRGTNIRKEGLKAIAKISTLTSLKVSGCSHVEDEDISSFVKLSLTSLHFDDCPLLTTKALQALAYHPTLLELDVGHAATDAGMALLAKIPLLTSLRISFNEKLTPAAARALRDCPKLVDLNVSNSHWEADAFLIEISKMPTLRSLDLSRWKSITDEGVIALGTNPFLTTLKFSGEWLTSRSILALAHMPSLISLELVRCNQLKDEDIQVLVDLGHLTILNISQCDQLTDEAAKALSKSRTLKHLHICWMTDEGVKALGELKTLVSLSLDSCKRLTDIGALALTQLPQLSSLDLSHCPGVTDKAVIALAQRKNITTLKLYGCKVTDASMGALSKSQVQTLDLSNTQVTDQGLELFLRNRTLKDLTCKMCDNITTNGLNKLKKNPTLAVNINDLALFM